MTARSVLIRLWAVLLYALLSACASTPIAANQGNDGGPLRLDQTIAVPTTAEPEALMTAIREQLAESGWQLVGYDAQRLEAARDYLRLANRAQYRLSLSGERLGNCRDGQPSYAYNLALIENRSGDVGLGLTGDDCLSDIRAKLVRGLERNNLRVTRLGTGG